MKTKYWNENDGSPEIEAAVVYGLNPGTYFHPEYLEDVLKVTTGKLLVASMGHVHIGKEGSAWGGKPRFFR